MSFGSHVIVVYEYTTSEPRVYIEPTLELAVIAMVEGEVASIHVPEAVEQVGLPSPGEVKLPKEHFYQGQKAVYHLRRAPLTKPSDKKLLEMAAERQGKLEKAIREVFPLLEEALDEYSPEFDEQLRQLRDLLGD